MKEKTKLKVAIIGTGMMGKLHAEAIRRVPGTEIEAIVGTDLERTKKIADELHIPRYYDDYIKMLGSEELDIVHNCTPNYLHFAINKEIIGRGINVYCEKPLAISSKESEELCRLAETAGVKAGVTFNYRHNAVIKDMRERVHHAEDLLLGDWGHTFMIRGHYIQDWMMYDTDYNWRCDINKAGRSRTIADIGSHWFDLVQYITGKRIVRVYADLYTPIKKRRIPVCEDRLGLQAGEGYISIDVNTEDSAFVLIELEDGVRGSAVFSQISGGHKNDIEISLDGSNYSMTWNQERTDRLIIRKRGVGNIEKYAGPEMLHGDAIRYGSLPSGHPVGWNDALKNAIYDFYGSLDENQDRGYASFSDGDYIVRIVEACLKSSEEKRWVDII